MDHRVAPPTWTTAAPRETGRRLRPTVSGKFLVRGDEHLFVRGVTYGTFRPQPDGHEYPDRITVEKDFSLMAQSGINAVRTYTVPPTWLLDTAEQAGLQVLVGLPLEREVGRLNDRVLLVRPGRVDVVPRHRAFLPLLAKPAVLPLRHRTPCSSTRRRAARTGC